MTSKPIAMLTSVTYTTEEGVECRVTHDGETFVHCATVCGAVMTTRHAFKADITRLFPLDSDDDFARVLTALGSIRRVAQGLPPRHPWPRDLLTDDERDAQERDEAERDHAADNAGEDAWTERRLTQ